MLAGLVLAALTIAGSEASAQPLTLDYQQSVVRSIEGATAAFALDPSRVSATLQGGVLTLVGRGPGATHVVVVIGDRTESFQVVVRDPPVSYLPGTALGDPFSVATSLYDLRYASDPALLQGALRASRREGDRTIEVWLGGASPLGGAYAAPFSVPAAAYTIRTSSREFTLFDRVVTNSPLTVSRSNVRGIHLRDGAWRLHAGYSAFATFDHLLLPTHKEGVFGMSYRYPLGPRSAVTPNVYHFAPATNHRTGGSIGTLLYEAQPRDDVKLLAELGVGRKVGGAMQLDVERPNGRIWANVRFAPSGLPSLSVDEQNGRQMEGRWTRYGEKLTVNANVSAREYSGHAAQHTSAVGGLDLQYRAGKSWSIRGGPGYATFRSAVGDPFQVRSLTLPVGADFIHRNMGVSLDYQFSRETNRDLAGHLARAAVNGATGEFRFSAYGERRTQTPTASHILASVPWLQGTLDRLGLTASTAQDLAELLRVNAEVAAYGFASNVAINLTPVRTRAGASVGWAGSGGAQPQVSVSTLFNRDALVDGLSYGAIHTLSYSQKVARGTELFSTGAMLCNGGFLTSCRRSMTVSLRQTLSSAPRLLLPQRQGEIHGTVFRDEDGRGAYAPELAGIPGVEVVLDGTRRTRTDASGRFRFGGVAYGRHTVEALLPFADGLFFTTPSPAQIDTDGTVEFGIGTMQSGLRGEVRNDAGIGLPAVVVHISGPDRQARAETSDDGTFVFKGLSAGVYRVSVDGTSLPAGYPAANLLQQIAVGTGGGARASFVVRPYRSVAGKVQFFDPAVGTYVVVAGARVELRTLSQSGLTDREGQFMFRDLPPGEHTLEATYRGLAQTARIAVPDGPAQVKNVNLAMVPRREAGERRASAAALEPPAALPAAAATRAAGVFVVQVAALKNARRAQAMVAELRASGLPAYLVEPSSSEPGGPYRVRLGRYSQHEAESVAVLLEERRGERPWVTSER